MRRIGVVLAIWVFLCSSGLAGQDEYPDQLLILSISPDNPVRPGIEVEFTVVVAYSLVSAERGRIAVGFNRDDPNKFSMSESRIVDAGQGLVSIVVKTVPVDWEERGEFAVGTGLTVYPEAFPAERLDFDQWPIELERSTED